jgi:glycosyltransferase involved in cell wall biosynthesis
MTVVSIIIPCRNEESYVEHCLASVLSFDLPSGVEIEVFVMDGMSSDRTVEVTQRVAAVDERVHVRANPRVLQSAALNLGLREARGEWVMRLDAHAVYPREYLKLCLETAERTGADNVGGVVVTVPGGSSYQARLVQAVTTHPFGVGNSGFRLGAGEGKADTVPYGFFNRRVFDRIGLFDERLVRAQDYEFNRRLIACGGVIWRNPQIRIRYYNQATLSGFLRKQINEEAPYNVYMWYVAPYAFTWRHAITGFFAIGVVVGAGLAVEHQRLRRIYAGVLTLYAALASASSIQQAVRYRELKHALCLPLCFAAFHLAHGVGILRGAARLATGTAPVQHRAAGRFRPTRRVGRPEAESQ